MRVKLILSLLLSSCLSFSKVQAPVARESFYKVITSQNLNDIEQELTLLQKTQGKEAFKGALLMKKSGLVTDTKDKLKFFKDGRRQLEFAINSDSTNAEYRFLRLLIQENAPKIVGYNNEIKKDASYLRNNYKTLNTLAQKALISYSKNSKELKPEDFKNAAHE